MINTNILSSFPEKEELLQSVVSDPDDILDINGHIHSPYSFSAFENIEQAIRMATIEKVKVLGINDFYSTAGYTLFHDQCVKNAIFPLFNIEFIGLDKKFQSEGIRVNDPNNPGRVYFSGKGLLYPFSLPEKAMNILLSVRNESQKQVAAMVDKVVELLQRIDAPFDFSMGDLMRGYGRDLVRERHIAKAIRAKTFAAFPDAQHRVMFLTALFGGKKPTSALNDIAGLEEEIRSVLLKAGGPAFVPEDENAFLPVEDIQNLILQAGGIPCYPVLLDDKNGNYTDFEKDKEQLFNALTQKSVYAIELIPGRNDFHRLKDFVRYFYDKKFIVTFGTEHNSPLLSPVKVSCRGNVALDDELRKIAYDGACVIAAHQYLKAKELGAYVDTNGNADMKHMNEYIQLGNAVIKKITHKK